MFYRDKNVKLFQTDSDAGNYPNQPYQNTVNENKNKIKESIKQALEHFEKFYKSLYKQFDQELVNKKLEKYEDYDNEYIYKDRTTHTEFFFYCCGFNKVVETKSVNHG